MCWVSFLPHWTKNVATLPSPEEEESSGPAVVKSSLTGRIFNLLGIHYSISPCQEWSALGFLSPLEHPSLRFCLFAGPASCQLKLHCPIPAPRETWALPSEAIITGLGYGSGTDSSPPSDSQGQPGLRTHKAERWSKTSKMFMLLFQDRGGRDGKKLEDTIQMIKIQCTFLECVCICVPICMHICLYTINLFI